jgi:hypothetical protein
MPTPLRLLFLRGTPFIVHHLKIFFTRFIATHVVARAHPIALEAGAEIIQRFRFSTADWKETCAFLSSHLIFVILMFSRATARLREYMGEFRVAASDFNVPRMRYTAMRAVMLVGEVALLDFADRALEQAVSLFGLV